MADKDQVIIKQKMFDKIGSNLQASLNRIYQKVNYSSSSSKQNREMITKDVDNALDRIISNNVDISGEPNISRLLRRLSNTNDKDTINAFRNMFEDNSMLSSIMTSFSNNRYMYDFDAEIDTILKYMPKLKEAMDIKRDNVLSSDQFNKDFINIVNGSNISEGDEVFYKRIEEMKTQFKLTEKITNWYNNASTYGEEFVYIVPYSRAFKQLFTQQDQVNAASTGYKINFEKAQIVSEAGEIFELPKKFEKVPNNIMNEFGPSINIEFNITNRLDSVIEEYEEAYKNRIVLSESSCNHIFTEAVEDKEQVLKADGGINLKEKIHNKKKESDELISKKDMDDYLKDIDKDERGVDDKSVSTADDGFVDINGDKKRLDQFNIPGCIIKTLDRHNVIPIYIEDLCLGYYYIECENRKGFNLTHAMKMSDPLLSLKPNKESNTINDAGERDKALRYIASTISKIVDGKFVNKNQDLKKEIYAILKYNQVYNDGNPEKIKVTFLPPEDVEHIYWTKDPETNRGISDLAYSLLPAKLYTSMYITNSIMHMTRGWDRRVWYVNTGVDTNVTQIMHNLIEQIKKSNFGLRQIRNNLNHVLNITGQFNDLIVPKSPSGDAPIQPEVIQGQSVDVKTEFMNMLEEMAINPTGVPKELTETRLNSVDYAIQLTMSSSKFLRIVFDRQGKYNMNLSRIVTKVYNYQYKNKDVLEFNLPEPSYLSVVNNSQFFDNLNNLATHIAEIEWDEPENDAGKNILMNEIKKMYAGTFYNRKIVANAMRRAKQLATIKPAQND